MTSEAKVKAGDRLALVALVIAAALCLWQMTAEYGGLSVAFVPLFWIAVAAWIACVALAILWRRRWWVLITAPVVLNPVVLFVGLAVACSNGRCF